MEDQDEDEDEDDTNECTTPAVSLDTKPYFEALSYI